MGLSMQYVINTSDTVQDGYRFRYAQPALFGDDEETKEFRIPMLWGALDLVPTLHREEAVSAGLCATVFLVQRTKVPWYQSGFFQILIIVIAVVLIALAIMNPGFIKLAADFIALAVGATAAFSIYLIYAVLSFAIGFIIAFASASLGGELGDLLTIVAAVAFFYSAGGFQNIGSTWSDVLKNPGWGTAASFLQAVAPVFDVGFQVHQVYSAHRLETEMDDFLATSKEKQEQLQAAWDDLGDGPSWIDPMDLVKMYRRMGSTESSDSYIARSLNPNPGLLGLELIGQYTDLALAPPREIGATSIVDSQMADFATQRGVT